MRTATGPAAPRGRPPVRVLAVSDEVAGDLLANLSRARSAALILACGDLPADYLGALMNGLDVPLVFVPGNHDPDQSGYRVSRAGLITRAGFPARPPWPPGAINADGRIVEAGGLRIAGLGGCLRYNDGPNQYTELQQARRARALRLRARWQWPDRRPDWRPGRRPGRRPDWRRCDVLLTHAPPRDVGDGEDLPHRGFGCYHGLVAALAPPVLLHGHVHPYGISQPPRRLGATSVRNVTGWHLLELGPTGAAEIPTGHRHAC